MTGPASFSGRRAPLLFGLLFVTVALLVVIVWVPTAICPACGGTGWVTGSPRLVLEEGRSIRKPSPGPCPKCDNGRVSVLNKWKQIP